LGKDLSILLIIILLLAFLLSEALVKLGSGHMGGSFSLAALLFISPVAGTLSSVHF
jgi:hypothetical protein